LGEEGADYLLLAFPKEGAARAAAEFLAMAAQGLDLGLRAEMLQTERRDWEELATIGEAVVGLTHGLNNSFNTLLLQAAVVQLKAPEPLREEVALIRQEGMRAAGRLRPLLRVREQRRLARAPQDLNHAVKTALAEERALSLRLETQMDSDLAPLAAAPGDLPRLVGLLLRLAAASQVVRLRLRTRRVGAGVRLLVEPEDDEADQRGPIALQDVPDERDASESELERLAVESLLKQVEGRLEVQRRSNGFAFVVSWGVQEN
jgi:hypothetical protein